MLKRAASRLLKNPLVQSKRAAGLHFKYEPEEAPAEFGSFFDTLRPLGVKFVVRNRYRREEHVPGD